MSGHFLSIGECMVELSQAGNGLLRKGFAGDTLNTAWYARAAFPAAWQVDYFTAVGDDGLSAELIEFISASGIGTSRIRRIRGASPGLYLITLNDGERSFSYWRNSSAARQLASDPAPLRRAIDDADIVYFSGVTLAILSKPDVENFLQEILRAKAAGKTIAFDPNIRPSLWPDAETMKTTLCNAAAAATIILPSFDDERQHFGDRSVEETIARYQKLGANMIIVKNGEAGAVILVNGARKHVPANPVDSVVDTTGAGDSFNGAFLAQFAQGADAEAAAAYAAKVAALVIRRHGALVPFADLPAPATR